MSFVAQGISLGRIVCPARGRARRRLRPSPIVPPASERVRRVRLAPPSTSLPCRHWPRFHKRGSAEIRPESSIARWSWMMALVEPGSTLPITIAPRSCKADNAPHWIGIQFALRRLGRNFETRVFAGAVGMTKKTAHKFEVPRQLEGSIFPRNRRGYLSPFGCPRPERPRRGGQSTALGKDFP